MSYITSIILHGPNQEAIDRVNDWLREHDSEREQKFVKIDMDDAGGTKWYTDDVWAAAFNYAPGQLESYLQQPATWGDGCLLVYGIIDGENSGGVFMFDYDENHNVVCVARTRDF